MSIRRHSLLNLAGSLAPTAVTLVTVPVYLKIIGLDRYGVLAIAWVFLGYFGVFDLGLGRATAHRIAVLREAAPKERSDAFWTAFTLNALCGIVGGFCFWPAAKIYFSSYFHVAEALRLEILATVPWLAAAVPVATVSGVLVGALQGRERFLALNACSVLSSVLFQLFPLAVAWVHGPELAWLVVAALIARVLVLLVLFEECRRSIPFRMTPSISRRLAPSFFRYGGWVSVSSFLTSLMEASDRFFIGALSGAQAVTYYAVPYNLANRVTVIPTSLTIALFPRFAGVADDQERNRLFDEAIRVLLVVVTPLVVVGLVIMRPFLSWWLSPKFAEQSAIVGQILLLGIWANCLARLPYDRLQAQGRPDLVAKCHLAELVPYMAILFVSLLRWGVAGAAFAWALRVTVDCLLLFAICDAPVRVARSCRQPILLLALATISCTSLPGGSMQALIVGGGVLLLALVWALRAVPSSLEIYLPQPLRAFAPKRG